MEMTKEVIEVPFDGVAVRKLHDLFERGYTVCGVAIERQGDKHGHYGAITTFGRTLWWPVGFHTNEALLYAVGAGGVGRLMPEPQQDDAPLHCDVCGVECSNPWHFSTETERHKHACDSCWNGMKTPGQVVELDHATPAQQKPVAWMYEWNGRTHITTADQRPIEHAHPHFNKSKPLYTAPQPDQAAAPYAYAVYFPDQPCEELVHDLDKLCEELTNREHVVTTLYTAPQPARQPLTKAQVLDLWEQTYVQRGTSGLEFARAVEAAHGITGGQQ